MTIAALTTQITRKDRDHMNTPLQNTQSTPARQSRRTIRRLGVLAALAVGLVLPLVGGVHVTHAAGNSDAAHACQQGGYLNLKGSDGTTFANEGQCVSYAAKGGTIVGISTCIVTSTTGCLTFNNATLPWLMDVSTGSNTGPLQGYTLSLTGSTSFVDACTDECQFSLPNDLATGGGTYVEKDSTGTVVSQGIYRIADTAGSSEGLAVLKYQDFFYDWVSSCAAATGVRAVAVEATLIDSSTGATQTAGIEGVTGSPSTSPLFPDSGDVFVTPLSSSAMSLTC